MRSSGASSTARYGIDAQAAKAAVERVTRGAGNPDVQTRQQYIDASAGGVNALLGVVYVLLLLAIVIALMGIANTLSLSIHERTRELGLLRAVGASRRAAAIDDPRRIADRRRLRHHRRPRARRLPRLGTRPSRRRRRPDRRLQRPHRAARRRARIRATVGVVASVRPARRAARLDGFYTSVLVTDQDKALDFYKR